MNSTALPRLLGTFGLFALTAATPLAAQETLIRGFGDVTYSASSIDEAPSSFALGQYDLFITSRLGGHWSFLGETVFEFVEDQFVADVERLVVEYQLRPGLRVGLGKMHTPIGYWFTQYHHGALLEPTIERPLAFRFEDEGGLLASHSLGLSLSGREIGKLGLGYDVVIGNGAASSPAGDVDNHKSLTVRALSQITATTEVGASIHTDRLPRGTMPDAHGQQPVTLTDDVDQMVFGAFVAHFGPSLEAQVEALRIRHEDPNGVTSNDTGYGYVGYRFGDFVPYALYDHVAFSEFDPVYQDRSHHHLSLGVRWDVAVASVLKTELRREHGHETGTFSVLTVQAAVAF